MSDSKPGGGEWAAGTVKNTRKLGFWALAWVLSSALAAFGPKFIWDFATVPTILGVILNLGIGFGMILQNKRYLKGLDEMQQKIFLEASALTLGAGLVCGLSYELLEDIKLIPFQPEISHLMMLMGLTFIISMIMGNRRYQ